MGSNPYHVGPPCHVGVIWGKNCRGTVPCEAKSIHDDFWKSMHGCDEMDVHFSLKNRSKNRNFFPVFFLLIFYRFGSPKWAPFGVLSSGIEVENAYWGPLGDPLRTDFWKKLEKCTNKWQKSHQKSLQKHALEESTEKQGIFKKCDLAGK